MQDYADGPPRGFQPLIGEGAWPGGLVDSLFMLLLILAAALCYAGYRSGRRMERQRQASEIGRGPEIIYIAVRRQIDLSLLATGESAFGPVRLLVETIEAYLGPVLKFSDGTTGLSTVVQKLRKALTTDKKKVTEPEKTDTHQAMAALHVNGHGGFSGQPGSTVIIATPPGGAGAEVASAAAVGPGGGVQVVQPARVIEIPPQGFVAQPPAAQPAKAVEKEVELSSRERAQALREALEALSDYWQKERVEGDLRAAQKALNITRAIGEKERLLQRQSRQPPSMAANAAPPAANAVDAKPVRSILGMLGL